MNKKLKKKKWKIKKSKLQKANRKMIKIFHRKKEEEATFNNASDIN